jgi:competence protein ComEC
VLLVGWCLAFVAGAGWGIARVTPHPAVSQWLALGLALGALAWRRGGRWRRAAGLLAWLAAGLAVGSRARAPRPLDPGLAAALGADEPVSLEATVLRGPEETGAGARLIVALTRAAERPAAGTLALSVANGWPDFGPGDALACRARLRELRGTSNPGVPDPTLSLRAAGIDALAGVGDAAAIVRRPTADVRLVGWPRRAAFLARRALRQVIERAFQRDERDRDVAALLRTTVLGDRRGIPPAVEEGFKVAGATHALSVSGLHLAAVAALLFLGARAAAVRVPRLPLYVDPRAIAAVVVLPAVVFYALLTGEAIATLRSAIMLAIALGALMVGRPVMAAPTIAAAVIFLVAGNPLELADMSLQLSVASVTGIALYAQDLAPSAASSKTRALPRRLWRWLVRLGAATAAATAATAPLVAHHFGEIAPLSPLGNVALVPLIEMGVVPFGLAGAVAGALWRPLGVLPLAAAGLAARAALAVAAAFRAAAPLLTCRTPTWLETAALTAAGGWALAAVIRRRRGQRPEAARARLAAILAALLAAGSLGVRELARRYTRALTITFLDVGQGDAAVVEAPGGAVMVLDGGGTRDGQFDTGARIVEPFLRARGIARLDVVALSHPHPDHLNGLFRLAERFAVGVFWSSGDDGRNPEYTRFRALLAARKIAAPAVTTMALGPARLEPLGPFVNDGQSERIGAPEGLTVNDASLVVRLWFAGRAVLFPGDLEADGEGELTGRRDVGQRVDADVLKVPHHGSRTSSSPELIAAVRPRLAIASLGWRNQFHFPAPEVLARYRAAGTRVLRTDRDGAITLTIAPDGGLTIACARGCPVEPARR